MIQKAAPAWPIDKLNRIDLAILRLAVFELTRSDTPPKVVIDEAVELAKEFGSEASASFVNGVLGTIYKELSISPAYRTQLSIWQQADTLRIKRAQPIPNKRGKIYPVRVESNV